MTVSRQSIIRYNAHNLLFIGRLEEKQKRISDLLNAVAKVTRDCHLHLIGDGPDKASYKNQVQQLGIMNRVTFHGYHRNPWYLVKHELQGAGALVLTSEFEGFPMALVEAISHGVYCISSDCETGPADIIHEGINGQLFPVGDIDTLAGLLDKVVCRNITFDPVVAQNSVNHLNVESYTRTFIEALRK